MHTSSYHPFTGDPPEERLGNDNLHWLIRSPEKISSRLQELGGFFKKNSKK